MKFLLLVNINYNVAILIAKLPVVQKQKMRDEACHSLNQHYRKSPSVLGAIDLP